MQFQSWYWITAKDITVGQYFITFDTVGIPDTLIRVNTISQVGNDVTINGTLLFKARDVIAIPRELTTVSGE